MPHCMPCGGWHGYVPLPHRPSCHNAPQPGRRATVLHLHQERTVNLSAAIMLVRPDAVFPVRVEYDPDNKFNNNPTRVFKTVDPSIAKDDLVIVTTFTRHGFTIAKVTEVGFPVDYNSAEAWGWIAGKFDRPAFDKIVAIEADVQTKVAKANENKMRQEIIDAMGLGAVSFDDIQLRRLSAASPDGVTEPAVEPAEPSTQPTA